MTSETWTDPARPVSQRVVDRVAAVTGKDPLEMEALYERIDPDGLNRLFSDDPPRPSRDRGYVAFPMAGCQVLVHADGTVEVTPEEESLDASAADEETGTTSRAHDAASYAAESPD